MFCNKCGAVMADDAKFCAVCGQFVEAAPVAAPVVEDAAPAYVPEAVAPVTDPVVVSVYAEAPAYAPAYAVEAPVAPQKKKNTLMIIIAVVAAVAIGAACLLLLGGGGFQKLLEDNMAVMTEGDISNLEDLAPECAWAKMLAEKGVSIDQLTSEEMFKKAAEAMAAQYNAFVSMGDVEYTVVNDTVADVSVKTEIAEELLDVYGSYGLQYSMIGDVQILEVEITAEAMGMTNTQKENLYAVEIDGDWYMMSDMEGFAAIESAAQILNQARSNSMNSGMGSGINPNDYLN